MNKIEAIRHSLSHLMSMSVQELYPKVGLGVGPAIDNGFYQDYDLPETITPEILPRLEKRMRELIKENIKFEQHDVDFAKAYEFYKHDPYKTGFIDDLKAAGEKKVSFYKSGWFDNLCAGPHVSSTKEINPDAFKLTSIAGAYWRGSEKNPMLTRIYGLAFQTKKELENYFKAQEEAEKRDHRFLGRKMDLFHIDENVGTGLILWHPKGAILKRTIENYALDEYLKNGYQPVATPHLAKLNLWRTSGHTEFYKENMFPSLHMAELGGEEKDDYQIKPMNCPFHIAIYKDKIRSYKNLPLRYTELGTVYRYEKSGTLHGLIRVRGLTQDDAHIFCTPDQLSQELVTLTKFTFNILKAFGFKDFKIYLSTKPEKYVGDDKIWRKAENSLVYALKKMKLKYTTDPGGGAFYGPKIDIKIEDALGREWQCTTIQLDFNLPERFDVTYIDSKGKKQRSIMIHRALLGSLERFIGILLEYHSGNLSLWLAPEQIWIIPIGNRHEKYANQLKKKLSSFRVEVKDENETVSKKIREGEIQKIPYLLVVGDKEMKSNSVRIRQRNKGDTGMIKFNKFLEKITKEKSAKK